MIIKISPILRDGTSGKEESQETESMGVALRQCAYYLTTGKSPFKFFVISKIKE